VAKGKEGESKAEKDQENEKEATELVKESVTVEGESEEVRKELEILREETEKAKTQAAEYLDGWQRTQAEFSNYKKRQNAEQAQVTSLANAALLRRLLPVVDDFERAIATLPVDLSQLTWCEGIFLIKHKMDAILESEGVKPIETEGQAFDPRYHEAVTYEQVPDHDEGQIIGEVQRGYVLGERVLRPALVRVAKAPSVQSEEESDTTENKE
jgi:molecular chaperone GrpE